jgi:hypothetical protein
VIVPIGVVLEAVKAGASFAFYRWGLDCFVTGEPGIRAGDLLRCGREGKLKRERPRFRVSPFTVALCRGESCELVLASAIPFEAS